MGFDFIEILTSEGDLFFFMGRIFILFYGNEKSGLSLQMALTPKRIKLDKIYICGEIKDEHFPYFKFKF